MHVVVAVERENGSTAHALVVVAGEHPVAYCGWPDEYLTVVPDLDWWDVKPDHRCPHCDENMAAASASVVLPSPEPPRDPPADGQSEG